MTQRLLSTMAVLVGLSVFAGCAEELDGPSPQADALAPLVACSMQHSTTITLQGAQLSPLALDAATGDPRLAIPDIDVQRVADLAGIPVSDAMVRLPNDPDNTNAARVHWQDSTTMQFDVYPELALAPGHYDVTVTNRNGKSATLSANLTLIAQPILSAIVPDLVCNAEEERTLVLAGEGFASISGVLPSVQIGTETFEATSLDDCTVVPGAQLALSLCNSLSVVLPQGAEEPGALEVQVTNPTPAQCFSEILSIALVPTPTLTSVEPDLFCTEDGTVSLVLEGTGFVDVEGELPIVLFDEVEIRAASVANCTSIEGTLLAARSCTQLTVDVPAGQVANGTHAIFVRNPEPAGCTSSESVSALVAGAPIVDTVTPPSVCSLDLPLEVTISGSGFLRIETSPGVFDEPEIQLEVGGVTISPVLTAVADCVALAGTTTTGETCSTLTFALPNTLASASYSLSVVNPPPADCTLSMPITFDVADAPFVDTVAPTPVCSAGDSITVTGSGFTSSSEVNVDGSAIPTTFVSSTELRATIVAGFTPGVYDVTVSNSGSCVSEEAANTLTVAGIPIVFFVDPPNNYSGIEVRLTVWVSGINGASPTVAVRQTGTSDTPIPLLNPVFSGSNQLLVTLPPGLPAGDYDVLVDDNPCPAEISNALHITDSLTVFITEMTPAFGADDVSTGVIIRSIPPGSELSFTATPRAYLTPQTGGEAAELTSVSFESTNKLTGVVPPGLTPGTYDLIIVNPDGQVGIHTSAFRVLPAADPPPQVADLLPSQVSDGAAVDVAIVGSFFPSDTGNLQVEAECRNPSDPGAGIDTRTASIQASAFGQIDTRWNLSGLAGFVCLVRVSNLANQSFNEFSALAVTNSSGNVNSFITSTDMLTPRRALGAAALRLNNQSRFIFAIGGDSGDNGVDTPVPLASVESAPVDAFGDVGLFTMQRNTLPEPRSFLGVSSVGRYVYAVGGRTGVGVVSDSVIRSYLLDPDEAPSLTDISLEQASATGLPGGIFYYRVAAVMEASHANNPSGEGLPSQPFVVQLPDLTGGVDMTLFWDAVPGASSYRLYRSPTPGMTQGSEVLLAEISHAGASDEQQSFVDDNAIDNSAETATPLTLGSLGVWHEVGRLSTAREGAAVVAVPDPVNTDTNYLYVLGGRGAGGAVLGTYEYVAITSVASNDQPVAATVVTGAQTLNEARWLAGAVYLDQTKTPEVQPNTAWVYVLKGSDASEGAIAASRSSLFQVDTANGGELINEHVINVGSGAGGYGSFAGNNTIFVFGGGGGPSNQVRSGLLGETGCVADCYPELLNLNAGVSMAEARYLHASTAEGAFIYLLGGESDTADATASTERTNL